MDKYINLIKIIDEQNDSEFVHYFSDVLDSDFKLIVEYLCALPNNKKKIDRIIGLAEFIFGERQSQHFGDEGEFEVSQNMEEFQELVYSFNVFILLEIEFHIWSDLTEILYHLLNKIVNKDSFSYKSDSNYSLLMKKKKRVIDKVREDPEMNQKYFDFLNGAL